MKGVGVAGDGSSDGRGRRRPLGWKGERGVEGEKIWLILLLSSHYLKSVFFFFATSEDAWTV